MDESCTAQVDKMSGAEAKVFLRQLLDGEAMRSPEVNQHVRKMLRGQRDQVAWFKERMAPGADAECLPELVDAKPKIKPSLYSLLAKPKIVSSKKKLCVKCGETPAQRGTKFAGCCRKCLSVVEVPKLCVKCGETPRQTSKEHEGCCFRC